MVKLQNSTRCSLDGDSILLGLTTGSTKDLTDQSIELSSENADGKERAEGGGVTNLHPGGSTGISNLRFEHC